MSQTIVLSEMECGIARMIGMARNKLSSETKTDMRRDPNQADEEMNVEAMGAELAVARYLNVYPDLSPTDGRLPDFDLTWRTIKIEVKRNHLPDGDLLVPKLIEDNLYILACGSLPEYTLIGFLYGKSIITTGSWEQLTYGPCWKVRPWNLGPIEMLSPEYKSRKRRNEK